MGACGFSRMCFSASFISDLWRVGLCQTDVINVYGSDADGPRVSGRSLVRWMNSAADYEREEQEWKRKA